MKVFLLPTAIFIILSSSAQDGKYYYDRALEIAEKGNLQEAILFFDKSISLDSNYHLSWFNRGIAKTRLNRFEEALTDFEKTVELKSDFKKGYVNLGNTRRFLRDFWGSVVDYTNAIKIDTNYSNAYFLRGQIYSFLGKRERACADYNKACKLGLQVAERYCRLCNDPTKQVEILSLAKTSTDKDYGLVPEKPIKVGVGPQGGPANEEAYFDLLRDIQGNPVKYTRVGSCCFEIYSMANGGEYSILDIYHITYTDEKGREKKKKVYITFYLYEEPLILYGFKGK